MIHDVIRSSTSMVCAADALEPLRQAVTELAPNIDSEEKQRAILLKDYDSYRRRLKATETKRETMEVGE